MELEIKTAEELADPALEARWTARRDASVTSVYRAVLRTFRDSGGPVSRDAIAVAFPGLAPTAVRDALPALDAEDVIQLRDDRVEVAYPFAAIPTAFTVQFAGGTERFACCAIDALGMSPMFWEPVQIASRCHHCGAHLALVVGPDGVGAGAEEVMVWVGSRVGAPCRLATSW